MTATAVILDQPDRTDFKTSGAGRALQKGLSAQGIEAFEVLTVAQSLVRDRDLAKACKAAGADFKKRYEALNPDIVLPLGSHALQAALGHKQRTPIIRWRGSCNPQQRPNASPRLILPTLHPGFVWKVPRWAPVLESDVERVGRVLRGGFAQPEDHPNRRLVIAQSEADVLCWLALLGPEVVFDVETVGLGPTETALVCYVISDGDTTVVIPWSVSANGKEPFWPQPSRIAALTSECFASRVVVTHNGPNFDHIVAERYGIVIDRWEDTLLMRHAVASHLPKSLAFTVTMAGIDAVAWKQLEDRGDDISRLWKYCGRDGLYNVLAYQHLKKELH